MSHSSRVRWQMRAFVRSMCPQLASRRNFAAQRACLTLPTPSPRPQMVHLFPRTFGSDAQELLWHVHVTLSLRGAGAVAGLPADIAATCQAMERQLARGGSAIQLVAQCAVHLERSGAEVWQWHPLGGPAVYPPPEWRPMTPHDAAAPWDGQAIDAYQPGLTLPGSKTVVELAGDWNCVAPGSTAPSLAARYVCVLRGSFASVYAHPRARHMPLLPTNTPPSCPLPTLASPDFARTTVPSWAGPQPVCPSQLGRLRVSLHRLACRMHCHSYSSRLFTMLMQGMGSTSQSSTPQYSVCSEQLR